MSMLLAAAMVVGAFAGAVSTATSPGTAEAGVYFNDVPEYTYKEYWTPHSTFTGGCGHDELPPGAFYIEPVDCTKEIILPIPDDTSHAIAALVYVDLWRNKLQNSAVFTINDGPQYRPRVGWEYSRTVFSASVPLPQLRQGNNSIKFQEASGPYHVHDVMVRVYYDNTQPLLPGPNSDVVAPTGQMLAVQAGSAAAVPAASGGNLNVDTNQVTLTAAASGAAWVEFHGFYDGYDEDNDGVTRDWHNFLRNNFGPGGTTPRATGAVVGHIGTDANGADGYSTTWNMPHIKNQDGVKFKVRLVDASGNVREAAGGPSGSFNLTRSYQVESYVIPNFQDAGIYFRTMLPQLHTDTIDLPTDLSAVSRAFVLGNYWNSPDLSINGAQGFQVYNAGEDVWQTSIREISPSLLRPGENILRWSHRAPSFGSMVEKPGPMIVIHRTAPSGAPSITTQPEDDLILSGEAAVLTATATGAPTLNYQWLLNGSPIPGATSATYTSPALLPADTGSRYSVRVTNGSGTATSREAMINVANAPGASVAWWNNTWDYRIPFTVFPDGVARQDKVVSRDVNFSELMAAAGAGGPTFDPNSIRVVEIDQAGNVINANVPFQFDPGVGYDPIANAVGTVVWQMPGSTAPGQGRSFHVYFDKTIKNIPAANVPAQLSRQAVVDQGFNSTQFNLADGSHWIFHGNDGGGFSRILDRNGVEWVGWNPAEGVNGDFRGIPNAVKPPLGWFHPGRTGRSRMRIVNEGPLRIRMEVTSFDNLWTSVWDIYPEYATMTMTRGTKEWWFLYEGIPGGEIDAGDFVQLSTGVTLGQNDVWEGDLPVEEWAYAADPAENKSFFVAHHENDGSVESWRVLDGVLPILGFGRGGLGLNEALLSKKVGNEPQHFTIGLADSTAYGPTGDHVRGAYRDVLIVDGKSQFHGIQTGALSDDFSSASLRSMWTYTDTVGDTSLTLTGSQLAVTIPQGAEHSTWNGTQTSPRLLQPIGDADLDIVAKFESDPTQRYQGQGILLLQDNLNWVRFIADHDGTRNRVLVQKMVAGTASNVERIDLPGINTRYLRVIRTGDVFNFQRSFDGIKWFAGTAPRTIPLDLTAAGLIAYTSIPGAGQPAPAFTMIADYFESKTTGGLNDDAPIISNVQVDHTSRTATITWDTNVPASTVMQWGPTINMGTREADAALTTSHSVTIDYLRCDVPYFFRPQSASDTGTTIGDQVSFRTDACGSIVSDDFSTGALGPQWSVFDPLGQSTPIVSSTNAILAIPAGSDHNLFPGENLAARLRQEAPVADFSVDAKFESVLTAGFQMQGIVVEEDLGNFLRFEIHHDGTKVRSYVVSVEGNNATVIRNADFGTAVIPANAPHHVRVVRHGNTFEMWHSLDGTTWTKLTEVVADIQASYVGPYIGSTSIGNAASPAFLGSIDYFFATASPVVPEDGGAGPDVLAPVLSNIVTTPGVPHSQAMTVTWDTDEPATTRAQWGIGTFNSGSITENVASFTHTAVIEPVNCGRTYTGRVGSTDAAGNVSAWVAVPFTAPPCPTGGFSDNFDAAALDGRWWFNDPIGDLETAQSGGITVMTAPGASIHQISGSVNAARMLQPVPNTNFDVQIGFESVVNFNTQIQGLVFEADERNVIRFDLSSNGTTTNAFVGRRTPAGTLQQLANVPVSGSSPGALRVVRDGANWDFYYSPDHRASWTLILHANFGTFAVARMGPYVGNTYIDEGGNAFAPLSPRHSAMIDYFWTSQDPITITAPSATDGPQFEVFGSSGLTWDGSTPFDFGGLGMTQPDINLRGRVTDPDGISSLTYSVNGGRPVAMSIGSTNCGIGVSCTRRLAQDGDFNADINSSLLTPGLNQVVIRSIDTTFHFSTITIPVNYTPGNTWPMPYSVDWSTVTDLNDVAQPIDGRWVVEGDHVTVPELGYDRLIAVGDSSWHSFEAEVPITINSFDPAGYEAPSGGPGVGFIPHWRGHVQEGIDQPKWGFASQLGALVWYRYRNDTNGERLEIRDSNAALVAEDLSTMKLSLGVTYTFKLQVETGGGSGPQYRLKVWQQGTTEPATWNIITSLPAGSPDTGSLALVAHHVDADFGDIQVRRITASAPRIEPVAGPYTGLVKVAMATDTRAGEIHYTLDGSTPTAASPLYTEPFLLLGPATPTIRAITLREGFLDSSVTDVSYSIAAAPTRVAHDLQVMYRFDEATGTAVRDTAFAGTPIDLAIEPGSDVTWLPTEGALRVNESSLIRTPAGANRLNTAIMASQSFTVEAWIDPLDLEQTGAGLFSIASRIPGEQNFAMTQQTRSLDVTMRTTTNPAMFRNTGSLLKPELHHLVFVRRPDNTTVAYVDGLQVWTNTVGGSLNAWLAGYGLSVANSGDGSMPWKGDLYQLAVYSDDLTAGEVTTNYLAGPYGAPANFAPVVSAGGDITIVQGETAVMAASASDDGQPVPPGALTTTWSQMSGPGGATIVNPSNPTTSITFANAGTYVFRWTGNDGAKVSTDDVVVTVITAGSQAPAPDVTPPSRAYPGSVTVTMASQIPDVEIRYTVDGSDPTASSLLYAGPFALTADATVKAIVLRAGLTPSPIVTRTYVITPNARVATGLIAYFPFNDPAGATIKDKSNYSTQTVLDIANVARTTRVTSGLRIDQPTVLVSQGTSANKINAAVKASNAVSVELWLDPASAAQANAMILGLSANKNTRNLGLHQLNAAMALTLRTTTTDTKGEPGSTANGVAAPGMTHYVFTRDTTGATTVYVNGTSVFTGNVGGNLGGWVNSHVLTLGAENDLVTITRPWLGTLYLVAFYNRSLTPAEVLQNYAFGDA